MDLFTFCKECDRNVVIKKINDGKCPECGKPVDSINVITDPNFNWDGTPDDDPNED